MKCCDQPTVCTIASQDTEPVELCFDHSKQYEKYQSMNNSHVEILRKMKIESPGVSTS